MPATLVYHLYAPGLGEGAYSRVYRALETGSRRIVAVKKSRASLRVQRPMLQHESRVLQLLQGHPAIPALYAYGRLPHFEYMAMELLGPDVRVLHPAPSGTPMKTCARVMEQGLAALEHVHSHGVVHRDVKPANLLCALDDPSRIKLIDFGIARPFQHNGVPSKYDPVKESRLLVGTFHWASLNSHNGIELSRRDDIESLAYVGLFLLRGDLPWRSDYSHSYSDEGQKRAMIRIQAAKEACSGAVLAQAGFPDLGHLLDYSRSLDFCQTPDYRSWRQRFLDLAERAGCKSSSEPLDWTPCDVDRAKSMIPTGNAPSGEDEEQDLEDDPGPEYTNSYWSTDYWDDRQYERDSDLTLPGGEGVPDAPPIAEVAWAPSF